MRSLLRVSSAALALAAALTVVGLPVPTASAASEPISLSQVINYQQTDHPSSLTVPAGAVVTYVINFSCATLTANPCVGGTIEAPFPAGLSLASPNYSVNQVTGVVNGAGNTRTFNLATLNPGATGQITVEATIPDWVTPDNTSFSFTSSVSTESGASNQATSNQLTLTARAANTTRATATKTAGGAVDQATIYAVSGCIDNVSPASTYGHLGVQGGSTLVVTVPTGAVYVTSSDAGVFDANARTVTWTIAAGQANNFCVGRSFTVSYPASDPANSATATKSYDVTWSGRKVGDNSTSQLGINTYSHNLTPASVGGGVTKAVAAPRPRRAAGGDGVAFTMAASNSGTAEWTTVVINDPIPAAVRATNLRINNSTANAATLWIKTTNGADAVAGNADDSVLFQVATANAGTVLNVVPYTSLPALSRPLAAAEFVTEVEVRASGIPIGATINLLVIDATVLLIDRDGVIKNTGDRVTNTATWLATSAAGNIDGTMSDYFDIDSPAPTLTVRFGSTPGNLNPGQRQAVFNISGRSDFAALPNPVYSVIMPPYVRLDSWSTNNNLLPQPTRTLVENFGGVTGQTLVRFTFPSGTIQPVSVNYNNSYDINLNVTYLPGSRGTMTLNGFISSASGPYLCAENYFGATSDANDLDGDGNLSEVPCKWNGQTVLAVDASAQLITWVKGYWDTAFAAGPAVGYSKPGFDDMLRVTIQNVGTVDLKNAVIVDVLPRANDSAVASSANRNPSSSTFPMILRAAPVVPTGLANPVTVEYSTTPNPCRPEVSYSPSGCAAPAWQTTPPANLADVTALKFDFGPTVMVPGDLYTIDIPVTTPTSGASEPEFAIPNPTTNSSNDEKAYNSAAFAITRNDLNSALSPSESTRVGLQMPSVYGVQGRAPIAIPYTSSGVGTAVHNIVITPPVSGSVKFVSGVNRVDSLTVANVGTFTLDPTTGAVTFAPIVGFVGTPPPIDYEITDYFNQTAQSTYVPSVSAPPPPSVPSVTTPGGNNQQQSTNISVPPAGSVRFVGPNNSRVTTLTVPGEGTFTIDPSTGVVTFTPEPGFSGTPTPVSYELVDAYNQTAIGTYTPGAVPTTTTVPGVTPPPSLPATGSDTDHRLVVAMIIVLLGASIIGLGRRRKPVR
jgi:uncharacterized repeat protein (TIGR01451 family)/LPXTG-motif cell wall-anchored protein